MTNLFVPISRNADGSEGEHRPFLIDNITLFFGWDLEF